MQTITVPEIRELRKSKATLKGDLYVLKENNSFTLFTEDELTFNKEVASQCADCKYLTKGVCPKVTDSVKKIERYLYIPLACEVISKTHARCRLIILDCSMFNPDDPYESKNAIERRRKLALLYYGVDTLEELRAIQEKKAKEDPYF